jgi:hypothetical protein
LQKRSIKNSSARRCQSRCVSPYRAAPMPARVRCSMR